jgi:hypothetical protein
VGKLVRYNRNKEEKRGYQPGGPVSLRGLVGISLREVSRRKAPEHKSKNNEPRIVELDLNAADLVEINAKFSPNCPKAEVIPAKFPLPVAVAIDLVDKDGPMFAAVADQVTLSVTVEIEPPRHAPARNCALSVVWTVSPCHAISFERPTLTDNSRAITVPGFFELRAGATLARILSYLPFSAWMCAIVSRAKAE